MAETFNRFKKPFKSTVIYGEDAANELFRAISIDSNGKLIVSTGFDGTNTQMIKTDEYGRIIIGNKSLKDPLGKVSLFNERITDSTDILTSDLTASDPPSLFRIYVAFDTELKLQVVRTVGTDTLIELLNEGNNLLQDSAYIFDIIVDDGESINFRAYIDGTGTTIAVLKKLSVIEKFNIG